MSTTTRIPNWATSTLYYKDEPVYISTDPLVSVQFHNKFYRAKSEHTSFSFQTDWGNGLWEEITIKGIKGDTGEQGPTGGVGPTGLTGPQGVAGADGSDGVFSEIASNAEALAGVDNTKGMTPLRVMEVITQEINDYDTDLDANVIVPIQEDISSLTTRIIQLEAATTLNIVHGQNKILNDVSVAEALVGGDATDGVGNRLELNSVGAKSATIRAEIYRKDDAETRFSIAHLELHFIEPLSQWVIGRTSTTVLVGGDDGVTFSVSTSNPASGIYVGQVEYASDNMVGGNYSSESYVKFLLEEISNF